MITPLNVSMYGLVFIHHVRKKGPTVFYVVHNFNKLKRTVLIFGKQHPEDTAKLL